MQYDSINSDKAHSLLGTTMFNVLNMHLAIICFSQCKISTLFLIGVIFGFSETVSKILFV